MLRNVRASETISSLRSNEVVGERRQEAIPNVD